MEKLSPLRNPCPDKGAISWPVNWKQQGWEKQHCEGNTSWEKGWRSCYKVIKIWSDLISLSLFIHAMFMTVKSMYIVHCTVCVILSIRIWARLEMVVDDMVKEKQKEKVENISGQEWIKIAQVTDRYSEYCCHETIQACSQKQLI